MAKKNNDTMLMILIAIITLFFLFGGGTTTFLGASVAQGGSSEITRTIVPSELTVNEEITVTYNIVIGPDTDCGVGAEGECNDYFIIEDVFPQEIEVTSINSNLCELITGSPQRMVCIKTQDAHSETLSFTAIMPAQGQQISFSGGYMIQGDTYINLLEGDSIITVNDPYQCQEDWECGSWSAWTFPLAQCGSRTRICTDLYSCGTDVDKPPEQENAICPDSECGNNITETGEVCDGTSLGGQTCASLGDYDGGVVVCLPTCLGFDTTGCTNSDGGGYLESCISDWNCTGWSACINETMTRTCVDDNNCITPTNVPTGSDLTISCTNNDENEDIVIPTYVYLLAAGAAFYLLTKKKKKKKSKKRRKK